VFANAGLFGLTAVLGCLGILAAGVDPTLADGPVAGAGESLTVSGLFATNVQVLALLVAGALTLGLATVAGIAVNGLVFGAVGGIAVAGGDPLGFLALTLPHVAVEFPAFWLAGAAGLTVPHAMWRHLRGHREHVLADRELVDALYLVAAGVALLVVAAVVEAHLTTALAELLA
jgi:uncharacterized membrane protein SpoIIM required for sporulation